MDDAAKMYDLKEQYLDFRSTDLRTTVSTAVGPSSLTSTAVVEGCASDTGYTFTDHRTPLTTSSSKTSTNQFNMIADSRLCFATDHYYLDSELLPD